MRLSDHMQPQSPAPLEPAEASAGDTVRYSVQINQSPGTSCAVCKENPSAEGPVGHLNDAPICDVCLLVGAKELGMLVALAVLVRAFADDADNSSTPSDHEESLSLLVLFARFYDRQASWPRRNEFNDDLTGGPLDAAASDGSPDKGSKLH